MDRNFYGQHKLGDIIIATSEQPYTGGNIFPVEGERYQLVQQDLSKYNVTKELGHKTILMWKVI